MMAPRTPASLREPPAWFDVRRYDRTNILDFEGWRTQVGNRIVLAGLLSAKLNDQFDTYFSDIQNAPFTDIGFDNKFVSDRAVYPLTYGVANAIVDSLAPHDPGPNDICDQRLQAYGQEGFVLSAHLTVDLDGSKEDIIKDFNVWLEPALAEYRQRFPRGRGPGISPSAIRSWHDFQILPYQDLFLWHHRYGVRMPSDTVMANWLFSDRAGGDKNKSRSTKITAIKVFNSSTLRQLAIAQSHAST